MRAYIVTGLGYGDEGKGTTVDYLVRTRGADTVVRFNGGPQAGHNVVAGKYSLPTTESHFGQVHHEFRQFGAGSFVPGVRTHLSSHCAVSPEWLFHEAEQLGEKTGRWPWKDLSIGDHAPLVTPFHVAANRVREIVRTGRHGSTGMGIWETEKDRRDSRATIRFGELRTMSDNDLRTRLISIQNQKRMDVDALVAHVPGAAANVNAWPLYSSDEISDLVEIFRILGELVEPRLFNPDVAVFEGGQGILLDEKFGWHPHTTGSTTTSANAKEIIHAVPGKHEITHYGVTRSYATRHGAGPFVTESDSVCFPEPHNGHGEWQHGFRQGYLDLVALRYAVDVDPPDALVLTHYDRVAKEHPIVHSYQGLHGLPITVPQSRDKQTAWTRFMERTEPRTILPSRNVIQDIEGDLGLRVAITSSGPTADDKDERWRVDAQWDRSAA